MKTFKRGLIFGVPVWCVAVASGLVYVIWDVRRSYGPK